MKEHIFNGFVDNICKHTRITREEFFKPNQNSEIVLARHTLFYLCHQRGITTAMIKLYMENNGSSLNRSPITHGISVIESKIKEDADLQLVIDKLSILD